MHVSSRLDTLKKLLNPPRPPPPYSCQTLASVLASPRELSSPVVGLVGPLFP